MTPEDFDSELHIGQPNEECACCRKPFGRTRRPTKIIRLRVVNSPMPLYLGSLICAECAGRYASNREGRAAVVKKVVAYCFDEGKEQ